MILAIGVVILEKTAEANRNKKDPLSTRRK